MAANPLLGLLCVCVGGGGIPDSILSVTVSPGVPRTEPQKGRFCVPSPTPALEGPNTGLINPLHHPAVASSPLNSQHARQVDLAPGRCQAARSTWGGRCGLHSLHCCRWWRAPGGGGGTRTDAFFTPSPQSLVPSTSCSQLMAGDDGWQSGKKPEGLGSSRHWLPAQRAKGGGETD